MIEGASYSLAVKYDKQLDAYLDSVIHLIAGAQEPDGYLTTCVTNKCYRLSGWGEETDGEGLTAYELYNCGHLYEAAVAHYRATGKRTLRMLRLKMQTWSVQFLDQMRDRNIFHPVILLSRWHYQNYTK